MWNAKKFSGNALSGLQAGGGVCGRIVINKNSDSYNNKYKEKLIRIHPSTWFRDTIAFRVDESRLA